LGLSDRIRDMLGDVGASGLEGAIGTAVSGGTGITGFMPASTASSIKQALQEDPRVSVRTYGGYRGASRELVAVGPAGFDWEGFDPGISYLYVRSSDADPEEMVSYLKAAGAKESELGDVFRSGKGVGVVAEGRAAARMLARGITVQGFPAEAEEADPFELAFPGQSKKEIRSSVGSMRLDAIAACGFPASRTRLAAEIELGRAKLNGRTVTDPAAKVRQGDVIIIKGRGRIVLDEEGPATRKGRISVRMTKYSAQ